MTPEQTQAGNGVGDDAQSWAYDGSRQRKWHAGSGYYGQYWYAGTQHFLSCSLSCGLSRVWIGSPGDFIGVAIDLDAKKMDFYRNGYHMGTAYEGFSVGDGLYPALTLSGSTLTTVSRYPTTAHLL